MICFGQDIPLSEKKDSTKIIKIKNKKTKAKINRKLKRELDKSLSMKPKDQIGYITNLDAHPWGGINYFHHWGRFLGWYIDWRPSMNEMHPEYWLEGGNYENITPSVFNQTLWTSILNGGLSFVISRTRNSAVMIYAGYGSTNTKTYNGYDATTESGYKYYEDGENISNENYNVGLLLQTTATISWQIGFDSELSGFNFGAGLTFD